MGVTLVPQPVRGLALLALLNTSADAALLPLLPALSRDMQLSGPQAGALVATTTVVSLVVALPVARLAATVGVRPLLLAAALLMPVALLAMAAAPGLGWLLVARSLFGMSFALTYVISPGVAAIRVPGAAGTAALGAAAGAGWLLGPMCAGLLAGVWGWRPALLVMAALTIPATIPFLRPGSRELVTKPLALRELVELARTTPAIAWSAAVAGLLGAVTGTIAVLVPTLLAANGIGPAGIGAAVTVSSVVWIVASTCAGHMRRLRVGLSPVGATVAALALVTALPVLSASTAVLVGFLVLAAACRAPLGALIYPLATRAVNGETGGTAIGGLLHLAWAAAGLAAPLLAGAAMQQGLERAAFAAVCLAAVCVSAGILSTSRRLAPA